MRGEEGSEVTGANHFLTFLDPITDQAFLKTGMAEEEGSRPLSQLPSR